VEPTIAVLAFSPPLVLYWFLDLKCPWAKPWRLNESDDMTQWMPTKKKLTLKVGSQAATQPPEATQSVALASNRGFTDS
jgi:hypothetical protein